ncbi:FecR family protein [Emcibacter sp.]|uniref:FecR family protein n=1 Tax=Emcibacter sp. TaxID=1979954 RepID=UPI003A8EFC52
MKYNDTAKQKTTERAAAEWLLRMDRLGEEAVYKEEEFQIWLNESEEHARVLSSFLELWRDMDKVEPYLEREVSSPGVVRPFLGRYRLAMSSAIAASLILMLTFVMSGKRPGHYLADEVTSVGEIREMLLEDGSRIILDTDSAVDIDYSERTRRIELIRGRASFYVAPDPSRPFEVHSGKVTATALGTVYSVRRLPDGERVSVSESKVKISPAVTIGAGTAFISRENMKPQFVSLDLVRENAWERGKIIFENTPLRQVIDEINRYNQGRIFLPEDSIGDMKVNGVFDVSEVGRIVDLLAVSFDLETYRLTDRFIFLYKKN